jgi:hypothetical protein
MSSCPDWRRLDPAARDRAHAVSAEALLDSARWEEALRHLDGGCQRCWQEALAADPTLVFRRLPAPELTAAAEAEEVEAARLAVGAMRTASRLERRGRTAARGLERPLPALPAIGVRSLRSLRSLHSLPLARWGLAAGLTAMALVAGAGHGWHGEAGHGAVAAGSARLSAQPSAPAFAAGASSWAPPGTESPGFAAASAAEALPAVLPTSRGSIEGLNRPEARVYQLDGPHMSVVMIVDDKLDV